MNEGRKARKTNVQSKRGRRSERGAAMLVVLLILVVSTAMGILAAYSTGLEVQTAGNVRQASQAQYLAELGVMTSFESYMDAQSLVDRDLDDLSGSLDAGLHKFYLQDLTEDDDRWPVNPVDAPDGDVPGSLGFVTELADSEVTFSDGYVDPTLVPRERINQLRRRVRVSGRAGLAQENPALDPCLTRTASTQGVLAAFSVQAELR